MFRTFFHHLYFFLTYLSTVSIIQHQLCIRETHHIMPRFVVEPHWKHIKSRQPAARFNIHLQQNKSWSYTLRSHHSSSSFLYHNPSSYKMDPNHFVKSQQFVPTTHRDVYPAIEPTQPSLSQKGKVIIITGASQGLGARVRSSTFPHLYLHTQSWNRWTCSVTHNYY